MLLFSDPLMIYVKQTDMLRNVRIQFGVRMTEPVHEKSSFPEVCADYTTKGERCQEKH